MSVSPRTFTFSPLPNSYAICKFAANLPIPHWANFGAFSSITRTSEELSIIVEANLVPHDLLPKKIWRVLKVHGPFDLNEVGVLASFVAPLTQAGLSVFTISTFDTDYLLIQSAEFEHALDALREAGHTLHHLENVS
jgi:hypothetical protein